MKEESRNVCAVCGKKYNSDELIAASSIRDQVWDLIKVDHPDWTTDDYICESDLAAYRLKYVTSMLHDEKGALSSLEQDVLDTMKNNDFISENTESQFDQKWTFGERLSDKIAEFGGSWTFIIIFMSFMGIWIIINSLYLLFKPFDPYPFILLNLLLSTVAAIQAPIIMMSQNRQEAKDRMRSENDYKVNLKSELEIRTLHEKLDHMLTYQWDRMMEIQKMQMELLSAIQQKASKTNDKEK
ncbi:MAG: DUF1003 domain-containing protein [Bacteroidales bacterium]|nr:DUF1003 domain-containing protein [Bacteroidales bacterium]